MVTKNQSRIIAALPAYNEEKYIGTMVLKVKEYVNEVIVVDDGSQDGTIAVAKLAGATVVSHGSNRGYGAAIQTILAEAKERDLDALVILDADYQHIPSDIPAMIEPILGGYDLVIGSRKQQKDKVPKYRRFGQSILSRSTRIMSKTDIPDTESGFRAFSSKAVTELELKQNGMAASAETISAAADKDLKMTSVPISILYTNDGSTLNPITHGLGNLVWIVNMISERRPLLFFGLTGVFFLILGILTGIRTLNVATETNQLPVGTALISTLCLITGIFSMFTGVILNALAKLHR